MICKIDLQKAYDNVSWSFVREVLLFYDISVSLLNLIMFCISNVDILVV